MSQSPSPRWAARVRPLIVPVFSAYMVAAGLGAGGARAQTDDGVSVAIVAVAKDSPSENQAVEIGKIARDSYRRNPRYGVLDLESVLAGGKDAARLLRIKEGDDALERGSAAYDAFELDPALEGVADAVVAYEQSLAGIDDLSSLADALRIQGAAFALKGEEGNALAAFERALLLDEGAALEGGQFPDTVQALYEQARTNVTAMPTGSATVYAAPAAAEVYIDGRFRGSAPLTVDDLRQGRHYVRIARDGYEAFGAAIDVAANTEETVQATLRPTTSLSQFEDFRRRMALGDARAAAELASFLKVDQLFWAVVETKGETVQTHAELTNGVTGGAVATADKTFTATSARYRTEVENWVAENFRKDGGQDSTGPTEAGPKESFMPDKPVDPPTPGLLIAGWVFTALTVVPVIIAIGTGVAALYFYDFYRFQGRFLGEVTGDPSGGPNQIEAEQQDGRTLFFLLGATSIISDVMWVISAAVLTSGITMWVIGANQKAEIDDVLGLDARPTPNRFAERGVE